MSSRGHHGRPNNGIDHAIQCHCALSKIEFNVFKNLTVFQSPRYRGMSLHTWWIRVAIQKGTGISIPS